MNTNIIEFERTENKSGKETWAARSKKDKVMILSFQSFDKFKNKLYLAGIKKLKVHNIQVIKELDKVKIVSGDIICSHQFSKNYVYTYYEGTIICRVPRKFVSIKYDSILREYDPTSGQITVYASFIVNHPMFSNSVMTTLGIGKLSNVPIVSIEPEIFLKNEKINKSLLEYREIKKNLEWFDNQKTIIGLGKDKAPETYMVSCKNHDISIYRTRISGITEIVNIKDIPKDILTKIETYIKDFNYTKPKNNKKYYEQQLNEIIEVISDTITIEIERRYAEWRKKIKSNIEYNFYADWFKELIEHEILNENKTTHQLKSKQMMELILS